MEMLRVKKLTDLAIIPSRGSKFAAGLCHRLSIFIYLFVTRTPFLYPLLLGFDLSSAYDVVVPRRGRAIVKTDLSIAIPPETYARIGNETKHID